MNRHQLVFILALSGCGPTPTVQEASPAVLALRSEGEPSCVLTWETKSWETVTAAARRSAERAAQRHGRSLSFEGAELDMAYQVSGRFQGGYLANVRPEGDGFAQLRPRFDVCTPAAALTASPELWEVVLLKGFGWSQP